jgi:hypothetical protein
MLLPLRDDGRTEKASTFEEERRRAAARAAFEEFTMVDVVVAMQSGVLSPSWRRSFMSKGEVRSTSA